MDATGGGIGKAAQELMQEMQKAQQEMQNKQPGGPGGPNEAFQSHMQQAQGVEPSSQVQSIQPTTQVNQANNVLLQARADSQLPQTKVGEAAKTQRSEMGKMLDQLIGGQDKMSQIMKLALSRKEMSSQELLAMQAGVYRFSQELDLTGKVIEKATSGVKQTMNTQV